MSTKADYWKLRESFYKCRDFEINNLWQKSILLTAFFVLDFTIYANVVTKLFETIVDMNKVIILHEICSALCIIGIVLSLIWIMMAKGSKAWYELYETAICSIEREKNIDIPESYKMGNIYGERPIDNNIFTNNAGCYSPSKLNIIIGRLFLIIWNSIYIIHLVFEIIWITNSIINGDCPCFHFIICLLIFIIVLIIYITSFINAWAKSSFLEKQ